MLSHSKVSMFLHLNLQPHHRRANIGSDLSHIQRTFQKQSTVYRAYQSTFDTAKGNRSDCLNGPPGLCPAFISVAGSVISPPAPGLHPELQSPFSTHLPSGFLQHRYSAVSTGSGCTEWGVLQQRTAGFPSRPASGPPWCSRCRWKGHCSPGHHLMQPSLGGGEEQG